MEYADLVPILLHALAVILIVVGLAGAVLPALPGVPLMFVGMLMSAWVGGFAHVGWTTLAILGGLTVLSVLGDLLAGLLGAKRVGASPWALAGAAIGTLVGVFLGLLGLIFGAFVGALIGELVAGSTLRRAAHVGVGAWIGFVVDSVLKVAISFMMLGVFVFAWVF